METTAKSARKFRAENVSLANVNAALSPEMIKEEQIRIMCDKFHYSQPGASLYLKRNNVQCLSREEWCKRHIPVDLKRKYQIPLYMERFNCSYGGAFNYLNKINFPKGNQSPFRTLESVEEPIDDVVETAVLEKPAVMTTNIFDDIKRTMDEIEELQKALSEKKEWLKLLMEEYIS